MITRHPARAAHRGQPRRSRLLAVLLAAAVLVGGANLAAYAVNGEPLLLGRFNAEGRPAVVKNNGNGPAMDLRSKPGAPSLKVSSSQKVPRLNADRVDGRQGWALQTRAWELTLQPSEAATSWAAPLDVPPGRYLATYNLLVAGAPICRFRYPDGSDVGFAYPVEKGNNATLTGTAILDTRGLASPVSLLCAQLSDSSIGDAAPSTISLVALNRVQRRTVATE